LTNVNSTLIENLPQSIPFIFTIYSGNVFGFDLSEGASGNFSTDSSFFFFSSFSFFLFTSFFFLLFFVFFFSFHFIFFFLFFLSLKFDSNIAIQCLSLVEDHALWKSVSTGEVARDFLFLYLFFSFLQSNDKQINKKDGICQGNYVGSPTRECFENGAHQGEFDVIQNPCTQRTFFILYSFSFSY